MKNKIKQEEEVKIVYTILCPICKRKIKGTKVSMVEYNLKSHMERKHDKTSNNN